MPGGDFVSTGYDWLIVSGNRATLQGTGTFNGNPGYGFRLTVKDGGSPATNDRIRVEHLGPDGEVVYDSQPGDPIGAAPTSATDQRQPDDPQDQVAGSPAQSERRPAKAGRLLISSWLCFLGGRLSA